MKSNIFFQEQDVDMWIRFTCLRTISVGFDLLWLWKI